MKEILLSQGKIALVDDEDYDLLNQHRWNAKEYKDTWYASRTVRKKCIYMHRVILNMGDFKIERICVDYISGDGLDNRKINLRKATHKNNTRNSKKTKSSSQYKGVHWNKACQKWGARIAPDGKGIHLGVFENEEDAAKAYDSKAFEVYGEFARLNFPHSNNE